MDRRLALTCGLFAILGICGCSDESTGHDVPECPNGQLYDASKGECVDAVALPSCDSGKLYDPAKGECVDAVALPSCDSGKLYDPAKGECVDAAALPSCDPGKLYDPAKGECVDAAALPECDPGKLYDPAKGECVDASALPECEPGKLYDTSKGECVEASALPECDPGKLYDTSKGECVDAELIIDKTCELGQYWDESEKTCIEVCQCGKVYDKSRHECVESELFRKKSLKEKNLWALQETAMAYYRRGDNIQYEDGRRSQFITPEDATSQHVEYLTCTGFVFAVFYQALGIELPIGSIQHTAYGYQFNGKNDDIIFYIDGDKLQKKLKDEKSKKALWMELLKKIEPGDVITYHAFKKKDDTVIKNAGHATFVYDLIKNEKNERINARILHSRENFEDKNFETTKLTNSLSWRSNADDSEENIIDGHFVDEPTGVYQGTIQKYLLSTLFENRTAEDATAFVVIRPTKNDKVYNRFISLNYEAKNYPDLGITSSDGNYNIQSAALCRMHYSNIEINKTLDAYPGSTVEPGQDLTYTIEIINHSDNDYLPIYVTEELSEYVALKDAGGGALYDNKTIAWYIPTIEAGKNYKISYTVTVKEDSGLLGKEIESTGSVAQISSKTIVNRIGYRLSAKQVKELVLAYRSNVNNKSASGLGLIQKIYKDAFKYDIPLKNIDKDDNKDKDMKLGALYLKEQIKDKNIPKAIVNCPGLVPYYDPEHPNYPGDDKNGALLVSVFGNKAKSALAINKAHPLANMIFNHYYGGAHLNYSVKLDDENKCTHVDYSSASVKMYEDINEPDTRTDRESMIYPETLHDGDILIYANTLDPVTNEDGTYAYIYLDGKFQGINDAPNAPKELVVRNAAISTHYQNKGQASMLRRFGDLPKLFGKDFYVILRPSLDENFRKIVKDQ